MQAEEAIKAAFNEVLTAEKAGVEVTDMLKELNQAVSMLSHVENSNRSLTQATFNGNLSQIQVAYEHAQHVKTIATNAQIQGSIAGRNCLLIVVTLSLISAVVFLIVLSAVWQRVKQSYDRSFLM
jgi:hypothetical protein